MENKETNSEETPQNSTGKLWNRNFTLIWQGQFISLLGSQAFLISLMFWIKDATQSATVLGLVMMAASIPTVIISTVGGALADRFDRKKIIVLMDMIAGVAVLSLAAMMYFMGEHTNLVIAYITFTAMVLGITGGIFRPTILAALPDLVPKDKLNSANAISQATIQFATLLGSGVGGVLYRVLGAPLLLFIDGITYLISALSESFITLPKKSKTEEEKEDEPVGKVCGKLCRTVGTFIADTKEGFLYLIKRTGMKEFFYVAGSINFFVIPCTVLLPFYVEDYLHQPPDWFGFITAALGVGSMFGFAIAGVFKFTGKARLVTISIAFIGMSVMLACLGLVHNPYHALLVMAITGMCNGFLNVNMLTIIQANTDDHMRGRVFGILTTITGSIVPVGMGLTGIIFDLVNNSIPTIYIGTGVILLVIAGIISLSKNYRALLTSI
ncbi:MAG: MFS transporter [Methylococcales bacterium]|jgi:MFS family permease|nr:MFS transporter [Methylococcales bacterium]MBT7411347.1 MFS transporter [Methylococcales bacterium]